MKRIYSLPLAVLIILAACCSSGASDIKIAADDLDFFIGTYDSAQNTFTDYTIAVWDTSDPMGFHNAMGQFPDTRDVYYGLAPWYASLAQAVLPVPEQKVMMVAMVDLKRSYSARAIVTKWRNIGDSLEFICVTKKFPDLGGAPNLDGYYRLPDSSYFLATRSAGGDMESIWRHYAFLLEEPGCHWREIYRLKSEHLLNEPEFAEAWVRLIDSSAPRYYLKVIYRHFEAQKNKDAGGSYVHEQVGVDTVTIDLWHRVQKLREQ